LVERMGCLSVRLMAVARLDGAAAS